MNKQPSVPTATINCNLELTAVLSTKHIPAETQMALGLDEATIAQAELWNFLSYVPWFHYGWIVFCSRAAAEAARPAHPALADLIDACCDDKIRYLKLDVDSAASPDFPVFN